MASSHTWAAVSAAGRARFVVVVPARGGVHDLAGAVGIKAGRRLPGRRRGRVLVSDSRIAPFSRSAVGRVAAVIAAGGVRSGRARKRRCAGRRFREPVVGLLDAQLVPVLDVGRQHEPRVP